MSNPNEKTWEDILSRIPGQIINSFQNLNKEEKEIILEHLRLMSAEEGWHPEQKISARFALETIRECKSYEDT